jgi:catechol 2,3-dioxygenase-like lactoylglutathione lyase family enzyme
MAIDHVDIRVSDIDRSRVFYAAALAPLGMKIVFERSDPNGGREVGYGSDGSDFAIHEPTPQAGQDTVTRGAHLAFTAAGPAEVSAFHRAAVAAGGTDIGEPGRRPEYRDRYYGAFVLDPDGNNVEAVCHLTEPL